MDVDVVCPSCGTRFTIRDELLGRKSKCTTCKKSFVLDVPRDERGWAISSSGSVQPRIESHQKQQIIYEDWPDFAAQIVSAVREGHAPEATESPKRKEYKVLTQKDKWFSAKFDPAKLEEALNAYAEQGWKVIAVTTASIPGLTANREEMVVILER